MYNKASGQPFIGAVSLTTGSPGPVNIPIITVPGGAPYTLAPTERLVITNISVSSNDTAQPLVTLDDGATVPRLLAKYYTGAALPAANEAIPAGVCQGFLSKPLRATATAVTAAKTVEILVRGYVTQTV